MINAIENLVRAWFNLAKDQGKLFLLELKLARFSVLPFCIFLILLVVMAPILWLSILVMLGCLLWYLGMGLLVTLAIVTVFNFLIAGFVVYFLFSYLSNMLFKHTRQHLKNKGQLNHGTNKAS